MWIGLGLAALAALLWGLAFLVPNILSAWPPIAIVCGRYAFFGLISVIYLICRGPARWKSLSTCIGPASIFSFWAGPLYYFGTVLGIRFVSAPMTVLVLGLIPLLVVWYSTWKEGLLPRKPILMMSCMIISGLWLVHGQEVDWSFQDQSIREYALGLGGLLLALTTLTAYIIQNTQFLQQHPDVRPIDWTLAQGVTAVGWAFLLGLGAQCFGLIDWSILFTHWDIHLTFWLGSLGLGVLCSWLGSILWNHASTRLPLSVLGPFMVLESICGLTYIYLWKHTLPHLLPFLGMMLMLGGGLISVVWYHRYCNSMRKSDL